MAVKTIVIYPDPILKATCVPVDRIDPDVLQLLEDLVDTMLAGPGSVGVAAPQIGVPLRACVVDVSQNRHGKENNHGRLLMVNPEIVEASGAAVMREGCMSVPDYTGDVERATQITLRFTEPTGPETYATVETAVGNLTLRVPGYMSSKVGDAVHVKWAAEATHLFDGETDKRIG